MCILVSLQIIKRSAVYGPMVSFSFPAVTLHALLPGHGHTGAVWSKVTGGRLRLNRSRQGKNEDSVISPEV